MENQPVSPTQQPVSPAQPYAPGPMSPSHSSGRVVAMVVVGTLLLVGAYAAAAKSQSWWPFAAQEPVATQTPSPSVSDTAGWKTYSNTQYGFEFKAPTTFTPTGNSSNTCTQNCIWFDFKNESGDIFGVSYVTEVSGAAANTYYTHWKDATPVATVSVAGIAASKYFTAEGMTGPGDSNTPIVQYVLLWQGHPFVIQFTGTLANSTRADQILSTFQFTK